MSASAIQVWANREEVDLANGDDSFAPIDALGMTVSYFRDFEGNCEPSELAIFQRAYEGACHKLGIVSAPPDPNYNKGTRDQLAAAIVYAARLGEREVAVLAAAAMAAAVRYRHAPRR